MKTLVAALVLSLATCALSLAAFGAEKGKETNAPKVIKKADLPASIVSFSAKKTPKFPGVPACSKGRAVMTWNEVNALPGPEKDSVATYPGDTGGDHKCSDAKTLYVCVAFGKLSIRCE